MPISEDVAIKAEYEIRGIPIADTFVGAFAWFVNAKVVTGDERFIEIGVELLPPNNENVIRQKVFPTYFLRILSIF